MKLIINYYHLTINITIYYYLIINYYHLTDGEIETVKEKNSDFSFSCEGKLISSQLCFFPMSLLYFSHRTLYF